ncbi:VWA domain-containing protein [Paenibacillus psychroresistens]|uniref:VWA domain-containing protein n=1 Tax=Paenibacillus psychroresistens TaxID=1778678 RepID=A0A6B8RJS3_9BACL|nr:VWA domain-containing protein [Paenibacillus psychroresistens]QGQ95656.1 VWA domain-containing protein [Paenibacillus psychroresistens]
MEFKNTVFTLYVLVPVLGLIIYMLSYRKKARIMTMLRMSTNTRFKFTRIVLSVLALVFMVFSLMGPQILKGNTEVSKTGLDIYFLIDTSTSMLVQDIEPDRISRAKKIIESLISNLKGDRIGFIPFSSSAYVQMPLTDDYQMAGMYLDVMDTQMIGGGGTDIGAAINLANRSFERTSSSDRVVIILSDGEEHGSASLDVLKKINDDRLKIYAVGLGSEKGGLIPVYDSTGERRVDYKKDDTGKAITSSLQPETLEKLAASGHYYQSSVSGDEINPLLRDISALKRDDTATTKIGRYKQLYQYFLGAGILLFLAAYLLPDRRRV